jgi:DNA-binding transcriptional ArsR family regulator
MDSEPITQNSKLKTQNSIEDPLAAALEWDWGTAYELLTSAGAIIRPRAHGLPAPWAAGVRKRLSPQAQAEFKAFFGSAHSIWTYTPVHLVLEMKPPKDVRRFLEYVEAIPDQDFSRRIHTPLVGSSASIRVPNNVLEGQEPSSAEVEEYRRAVGRARIMPAPSAADVRALFSEMADPATTKRRWLSVMREYHSEFFAEEEKRIAPVLKRMLEKAQALSRTTTVTDLIERLSNGFTISGELGLRRLMLVPSVWCYPFVVGRDLAEAELLLLWGARPSGYKLAPGESVPDEAVRALRALGDPTRLRLLRLLTAEPRSPQALARELKLSLPTVSHHMRELRLAGLIRLEVGPGEKGRESRYTVRWQSAERAFQQLEQFVKRKA